MYEPFGTAALVLRQLWMLLLVKGAQYLDAGCDAERGGRGVDAWLAAAVRATGLREAHAGGVAVHLGLALGVGGVLWAVTLCAKMLLGWGLKRWATAYNRYYDHHYGSRFFKSKARDS